MNKNHELHEFEGFICVNSCHLRLLHFFGNSKYRDFASWYHCGYIRFTF
jgi:hypothetical protein